MRDVVRLTLALALLTAVACGGSHGLGSVPEGAWGGENLALTVHTTGADVGLDCAHGAITVPLGVEGDGSFTWPGYFVHDVGPTLDPEVRRPATYFGSYDGQRLTLTVSVDEGGSSGPFTATLGGVAELQQCR